MESQVKNHVLESIWVYLREKGGHLLQFQNRLLYLVSNIYPGVTQNVDNGTDNSLALYRKSFLIPGLRHYYDGPFGSYCKFPNLATVIPHYSWRGSAIL